MCALCMSQIRLNSVYKSLVQKVKKEAPKYLKSFVWRTQGIFKNAKK